MGIGTSIKNVTGWIIVVCAFFQQNQELKKEKVKVRCELLHPSLDGVSGNRGSSYGVLWRHPHGHKCALRR
jgi:hypothetical protein